MYYEQNTHTHSQINDPVYTEHTSVSRRMMSVVSSLQGPVGPPGDLGPVGSVGPKVSSSSASESLS